MRSETMRSEMLYLTHHLVETHHWAPKRKFKLDADLWPTSRLCKYHHDEWHKVIG